MTAARAQTQHLREARHIVRVPAKVVLRVRARVIGDHDRRGRVVDAAARADRDIGTHALRRVTVHPLELEPRVRQRAIVGRRRVGRDDRALPRPHAADALLSRPLIHPEKIVCEAMHEKFENIWRKI